MVDPCAMSLKHDLYVTETLPDQAGLLCLFQFDAHWTCRSIHWTLETVLVE